MTVYNVLDHGARGDGTTDDRAAVQAVIDRAMADGGGEVFIPPAVTCLVGPSPIPFRCLTIGGDRVRLFGEGTLLQAPSKTSVRLLHVSGTGHAIDGVTLDGNAARQSLPDGHRAGIFADGTIGLLVERVTALNFTGDGMYLYRAEDTTLERVRCARNGRNGLTLGGHVAGLLATLSRFEGNAAQQFDTEPGKDNVVSAVQITRCKIDGSTSNDYALTISGTAAAQSHTWVVENNTIRGGVLVTGARNVKFGRNRVINHTTKPCVEIERACDRVRVSGNELEALQEQVPSIGVVYIEGSTGSGPSRVLVAGNRIRTEHPNGFGVWAQGAVSVSILGNDIGGKGSGLPMYAGVFLRATHATRAFESAVVNDNEISGYPRGVFVAGNGPAQLLELEVQRNSIAGARQALVLDDGSGAAKSIVAADNEVLP